MQLAEVIGHATSTVKHPTLRGWRMLIVQPLDARQQPDGVPILAFDSLGGARGERVIISSDGKAARELVGAENSPIRWIVIGLADDNMTTTNARTANKPEAPQS
jgi:ethanolamine utilization protein EutN